MIKALSILVFLIFLLNGLHSQVESGRILFNKSIEVHFVKDKSATIIKFNDEISSSTLIDVNKKHLYEIKYEKGTPKSYKMVDLESMLTESEKISLESQLLSPSFKDKGFGLVENDLKVILGYRCYKIKTFDGHIYCTDSIPSLVNIWSGFKKMEGGIPLEQYFERTKETVTAISIVDQFDAKLFDINFDQLINEDVEKENKKSKEVQVFVTEEANPRVNDKVENEDYLISSSKPFPFRDSGLSMMAPTKYLKHPIFECIGAEDLWFAETEELIKSDENIEFLRLDTLNMENRYTKIQSFFAPFFQRLNYPLSSEDTDKDFIYSSSYITKIGNHEALIIHGKSKGLQVKYITIFTGYTYVLTKILHKPNLPYFNNENIGKYFKYNDGFLSKYSKKMPFSIDLDPEKFQLDQALSSYLSKDKGTVINFKLVPIRENTLFDILNTEKNKHFISFGTPSTDKTLCQGQASIRRLIIKADPKIKKFYQQIIKLDDANCVYLESLHYENSTMSIDEIKSIFEKCKFK